MATSHAFSLARTGGLVRLFLGCFSVVLRSGNVASEEGATRYSSSVGRKEGVILDSDASFAEHRCD